MNFVINERERIVRNCSEQLDRELGLLRFDEVLVRSGYSERFIRRSYDVFYNRSLDRRTVANAAREINEVGMVKGEII